MKYLYQSFTWCLGVIFLATILFSCITPVKPAEAEAPVSNEDVLDTPNLRKISANDIQIKLGWNHSNLNKDNFGAYIIKAKGNDRKGKPILPNDRIILDADTVTLDFFGLSAGTAYTFQITVQDKKGNVHGRDETLIYTEDANLKYELVGSHAFPEGEEIVDIATSATTTAIYVATNVGIYLFDQTISSDPGTPIVKNSNIKKLAVSSEYLFYATPDGIVSVFDSRFDYSYPIKNVRQMRVIGAEPTINLAVSTPDSILVLSPTLLPIPSSRIVLTNKNIHDFIVYPQYSPDYYIATDSGVFYQSLGSNEIIRTVANDGGGKYVTLSPDIKGNKIVVGRYPRSTPKVTDFGMVSSLAVAEQYRRTDITDISKIAASGLYIKKLDVDEQGIISMLVNGKMYLYGLNFENYESYVFTVPATVNTSDGYSTHLLVRNSYYYYVAGKNKISVFNWDLK